LESQSIAALSEVLAAPDARGEVKQPQLEKAAHRLAEPKVVEAAFG
jgi:hypothetical protein